MTRNRTYVLTGISAVLFVLLNIIFANGMFSLNGDALWQKHGIASSTIFTYVLLAAIIVIGFLQAQRLPAEGIVTAPVSDTSAGQVDDPVSWKLLMGNVFYSLIWVPVRFFVGRDWLAAGEHKVRDAAWVHGGQPLKGYWLGAIGDPAAGKNPKVAADYNWFGDFLNYMVKHEWYTWFAKVIAYGEVLVGIGLIVGALVGIAAFFGTFMNFNFMLAGSSSTNPVLFGLGVFLVLAWKVAGYWGLDRYLLPLLGTPWHAGSLIKHQEQGGTGYGSPRGMPAD